MPHMSPIRIGETDMRRIAAFAFGPDRSVDSASPLGGGSINDTRLLRLDDGTEAILRVAPGDAAASAGPSWYTAHGLRREAAVIALASPALGPLLPRTIAHDFERRVIDRDWVIQRRMPGVPLADVDASLPPAERAAVWLELGRLTRALHDVQGEWFGPPVASPRFDRLSALIRDDADGLLDDARRFDLPLAPFQRLAGAVDRAAGLLDANDGSRLVHSDLARSHVFVAREHSGPYRVAGIIDLEFGRFADPLMERLIASFKWDNAPAEMKETFFEGYGRAFDTPEDRTRLRVYVAIALAWSATILAFQGRRNGLPRVITGMEQALNGPNP